MVTELLLRNTMVEVMNARTDAVIGVLQECIKTNNLKIRTPDYIEGIKFAIEVAERFIDDSKVKPVNNKSEKDPE